MSRKSVQEPQNGQRAGLVICAGKGAQRDIVQSLSGKLNAPVQDSPGEELTLMVDAKGIALTGFGLTLKGDFEQMLRRISDGRLAHEMLVHVTKTETQGLKAIDATAGMGEDSLLLAASGYEVVMYEQNPVIAALLRDSIRRAKKNPKLKEIVSRMKLIEGNSAELMHLQTNIELIYLDPMFPSKKKSSLTNKKLQLIQKLEQPCFEEEVLLDAAIAANPKKIIIKRPHNGKYLADRKPDYSVSGKAIRYDCFSFK